MRKAFVVVSALLLAAFALQFVFAAVGAFTEPAGDGAYALHSVNGMAVIPALTLLTTLFAALAKAPGRLIGLAILPLGLVVVQALHRRARRRVHRRRGRQHPARPDHRRAARAQRDHRGARRGQRPAGGRSWPRCHLGWPVSAKGAA